MGLCLEGILNNKINWRRRAAARPEPVALGGSGQLVQRPRKMHKATQSERRLLPATSPSRRLPADLAVGALGKRVHERRGHAAGPAPAVDGPGVNRLSIGAASRGCSAADGRHGGGLLCAALAAGRGSGRAERGCKREQRLQAQRQHCSATGGWRAAAAAAAGGRKRRLCIRSCASPGIRSTRLQSFWITAGPSSRCTGCVETELRGFAVSSALPASDLFLEAY